MSREWKPGDVAMIPFARGDERAFWTAEGWVTHDFPDVQNRNYSDVRPLVVIDPEDREAVERLVKVLSTGQPLVGLDPTNRGVVDAAWIKHTQAALREYANPKPPRPDEPKGLGAVVEDEDGELYVRHGSSELDESVTWCNSAGVGHSWARIAAVRVLSPGVEVDQ